MRGTGGVVMTEVRRNAAGLSLDEALAGRVSIRNGQQRLVAELNKSPGREVELGLVPGDYTLFLETWDADWRLAELVLTEGEFAKVSTGDFRALTPEETKLRGGSGRRITLGRHIEVATREGYTLSLGLLTNTQDEAFRGVQFAWLVNQARGRTGSQVGGLGNLALKEVDGWQASVVGVNWAMGPLQGGQVGLINIASQVRGWQVAQTTNIVGKIRGWQVAGVTNFVGEVKGGQVGLLNVASEVKGWQVGLVNLSGHIEGGLPIGLINYSRSGLFNFSAWRDEIGFTMFTIASGSRSSTGGNSPAATSAASIGAAEYSPPAAIAAEPAPPAQDVVWDADAAAVIDLPITGMTCAMCQKNVSRALSQAGRHQRQCQSRQRKSDRVLSARHDAPPRPDRGCRARRLWRHRRIPITCRRRPRSGRPPSRNRPPSAPGKNRRGLHHPADDPQHGAPFHPPSALYHG